MRVTNNRRSRKPKYDGSYIIQDLEYNALSADDDDDDTSNAGVDIEWNSNKYVSPTGDLHVSAMIEIVEISRKCPDARSDVVDVTTDNTKIDDDFTKRMIRREQRKERSRRCCEIARKIKQSVASVCNYEYSIKNEYSENTANTLDTCTDKIKTMEFTKPFSSNIPVFYEENSNSENSSIKIIKQAMMITKRKSNMLELM